MPHSSSPQRSSKLLHSSQSSVHVAILGAGGRMSRAVIELLSRYDAGSPTVESDGAVKTESGQAIKVLVGIERIEHRARVEAERNNAASPKSQPQTTAIPFAVSLEEATTLAAESGHTIDVLIDFSYPAATLAHLSEHLRHPQKYGFRAWVIGTTGFTVEQEIALEHASKEIAILRSGNFSQGIFVLLALLKKAATLMGQTCDYEIVETHHRHKKDAPSGTAKMLANALTNVLDPASPPQEDSSPQKKPSHQDKWSIHYGRAATNTLRKPKEIGMASLRGGNVIGDHALHILSDHEKIVLSHHAFDRLAFTSGIPAAVQFVAKQAQAQKYGLYSLEDALYETLGNAL